MTTTFTLNGDSPYYHYTVNTNTNYVPYTGNMYYIPYTTAAATYTPATYEFKTQCLEPVKPSKPIIKELSEAKDGDNYTNVLYTLKHTNYKIKIVNNHILVDDLVISAIISKEFKGYPISAETIGKIIDRIYSEVYSFRYKGESLSLGEPSDWDDRLGVLERAKTLLLEQMDNGGYLTEAAFYGCVRRAERELSETAKCFMSFIGWLTESRTSRD